MSANSSVTPAKVQTSFTLNFNKPFLSIDGEEQKELNPAFKGEYKDIKESDYHTSKLNKILGRALALSNEDFEGKEFEWYSVLYETGVLQLDATDTRRLKQFIVNKRKAENPFSNILVKQLFQVFIDAKYTE